MTWLAYVMFAATVAGYAAYGKTTDRNPLHPWDAIGAAASVYVANHTADSVTVYASAPEVDRARRRMGSVPAYGENVLRIPYADTDVRLSTDGTYVLLQVRAPQVFTWVIE
jgi:hypothetical protein